MASQFELLVTSSSGKSKSYKVSEEDSSFDFSCIQADFGEEAVVLSFSTPFEAKSDMLDAPLIPKPTDKDSVPPKQSEEKIVSVEPYYKTGDFQKGGKPVNVTINGTKTHFPAFNLEEAYNKAWVQPHFPTQRIQLVRFWKNTFYTGLAPKQQFSKSITTIEGMEKLQEETFSAELGVEVKGLSAKLSYALKNSVTIKSSIESTDTYNYSVPKDKVASWTLWQLVEKFVFVDENDKPIDWKGNAIMKMSSMSMNAPASFNNKEGYLNRLPIYNAQVVLFDA
jgi:starvation-inducible outer membrane lipoprotein